MIHVGTAGFKYQDWKGTFYPQDLKDKDMLSFYAQHFDAVELDFTYYHLPNVRTMSGIEAKTPDGFHFTVKAHRSMTHEIPQGEKERKEIFGRFREALTPMVKTGKLGCVLVQFPWSFRPGPRERSYVFSWPQRLPDVPLVVEFRHTDWLVHDIFQDLIRHQMGFCCVDEPRLPGLLPALALATSAVAYVRYHGRNARKWWKHETVSHRYDYLYAPEELQEWVGRIQSLTAQANITYVMFNNCHEGHAATNARMMQVLLEDQGS